MVFLSTFLCSHIGFQIERVFWEKNNNTNKKKKLTSDSVNGNLVFECSAAFCVLCNVLHWKSWQSPVMVSVMALQSQSFLWCFKNDTTLINFLSSFFFFFFLFVAVSSIEAGRKQADEVGAWCSWVRGAHQSWSRQTAFLGDILHSPVSILIKGDWAVSKLEGWSVSFSVLLWYI